MRHTLLFSAALALPVSGIASAAAGKKAVPAPKVVVRSLAVSPASLLLEGKGAEQALLVSGGTTGRSVLDLTRAAVYRSSNPKVAQVTPGGLVRIVGDGAAVIEVRAGGQRAAARVRARNSAKERPLSFQGDVMPVLSKAGCYTGACHAKQGGQNGFQLSVLGFDAEADYSAVVRQGHGRRVDRISPGRSLFLTKPTLAVAHAGGRRFTVDSPEYRLLARWIANGAPFGRASDPALVRVEVQPAERVLQARQRQQLLATAVYSDGSRRDVTRVAEFRSNETAIAEVDDHGLIQASDFTGEAAVMVRYLGQVAVSRVTVPLKANVPASAYARLPRFNFIDEQVYRKLGQLNLQPSPLCDDATFLRRASLDLIGTLPTAAESRAFLAECAAETGGSAAGQEAAPALAARVRLVERLLKRPEYGDYWGMRWVNLLLVDRDPLFPKGAYVYDRWVRDAFRANMPFDRFAREIVTASGETYRDGPANFYRSLSTPVEHAKAISQLFLGVRIDCAQCHHHPNERWGQDDFYSMAAYFARVRSKGTAEFEVVVFPGREGEVTHPKTAQAMPPRPLGGAAAPVAEGEDRREHLAQWMTAPENPYFSRAIVNRMWALLMGRGLVEPVDDFRVTNPASNEALLDALAREFSARGFDLHHLIRTITASAAYQRSSKATATNARDTRNYSRFYVKRVPAEVLLDGVSQATGVPEKYPGHPAGTRAIQMWDNKLPVEFLEIFGRPARLSVCECERPADGSVTQVLHLMNSPAIQNRLSSDSGLVAELDKSGRPPDEVIAELYLAAYSRPPLPEELAAARAGFTRAGATRRSAIEDLLWVLLNTPEFVFNH
ncbi:MAG TPA: DUF1553 domain-containing protein [Armatimonadota bacterium]|nr:DUF1553 domain-containing protein [Armatimonadota bacterium]